MFHLRERLEDDPANPRFLCTLRRAGYYFDPCEPAPLRVDAALDALLAGAPRLPRPS